MPTTPNLSPAAGASTVFQGLAHAVPILVVVLILVVLAGALKIALQWAERKRLHQSGITDIDRMEGRTFEQYLAVVFRVQGYAVELTPASKDRGADLVLTKARIRTVVQAKCWKGHVGVEAVQQIVTAKAPYRAQQAMVVTNSRFTKAAQVLAQSNGVQLWDRPKLLAELVRADAKQAVKTEGPPLPDGRGNAQPNLLLASGPRRCPRCGKALVERMRRQDGSRFIGCSGYPLCRYTEGR